MALERRSVPYHMGLSIVVHNMEAGYSGANDLRETRISRYMLPYSLISEVAYYDFHTN